MKELYVFIFIIVIVSIFLVARWKTSNRDALITETDKITIRVNTFKRNDLLEEFLLNHHTCDVVQEIQVIWSDQDNKPPLELQKISKIDDRIKFEVHTTNSLNNRFLPLLPIATQGVLSVDDDIVIPCDVLERSVRVWTSNKKVLVGYSPRIISYDPYTGVPKYSRWQHTWWTGQYDIILTKASFLHAEYLYEYEKLMSKETLDYIDQHRNCEDIAMAHLVAHKSKSPSVWIDGVLFEISSQGISTQVDHFSDRSKCVYDFDHLMKDKSPWTTAYQKSISLDLNPFNYISLYRTSGKI